MVDEHVPCLTKKLRSWQKTKEYLLKETPPASWIFRGQRDAKWLLKTTLDRALLIGLEKRQVEFHLCSEARKRAQHFLPVAHEPKDLLEWIALLQHYGAPTRLLDFTESPYVAVFFAIEHADNEKECCCVWAINETTWCNARSFEAIETAMPQYRNSGMVSAEEIFRKLQFDQGGGNTHPQCFAEEIFRKLQFDQGGGNTLPQCFAEEIFRKLQFDQGAGNTLPQCFDGVFPVRPSRMNERIAIQHGCFLCTGNPEEIFDKNLRALAASEQEFQQNVVKIMIPVKWRIEVLEDLNAMNIDRATLFPGLDGFVQSLSTRPVLLALQRQSQSMNRTVKLQAAQTQT